jgi:hypothetical protein
MHVDETMGMHKQLHNLKQALACTCTHACALAQVHANAGTGCLLQAYLNSFP